MFLNSHCNVSSEKEKTELESQEIMDCSYEFQERRDVKRLIYPWGHHPQLHLFYRQQIEPQITQKTKVIMNIDNLL